MKRLQLPDAVQRLGLVFPNTLAASSDWHGVLQVFLDMTSANYGVVYSGDGTSHRPRFDVLYSSVPPKPAGKYEELIAHPSGMGVEEKCFRTGTVVYRQLIDFDPSKELDECLTREVMAIPILNAGRSLGLIYAERIKSTPGDITFPELNHAELVQLANLLGALMGSIVDPGKG